MEKLRITFLWPAELADTIKGYIKVIEDALLEESFLTRLIGLLYLDLALLNQAIVAVRINGLVVDLITADDLRDDLFKAFKGMVEANKTRRDPVLVAAYRKIWPLIEKAGTTLYALGYVEESGKLEALLNELEGAEYQTAMGQIGALGLFVELKQAQKDFAELYALRHEADMLKTYPTLQDAKKKAVLHLNTFFGVMKTLLELEPEKYAPVVDKLNAITNAIMITVKGRKSRGENGSQEDPETDPKNDPEFDPENDPEE
jgi:hypothetical protein